MWDATVKDQGETILFVDEHTGAPAGYATWRHRNLQLPHGKEIVIELHFMGVAVDYQHTRCSNGDSVATQIFDTVEAAARAHERSTPDMPIVLEVDPGNEHAQKVYEHWEFEHLEYEDVLVRGRYNRMLRPASPDAHNGPKG
jgi:ribosomal protein S18 acetylase RimI-like enzyme